MTRAERRRFDGEVAAWRRDRERLDGRLRRGGWLRPTVLRRGPETWPGRTRVTVRQ